MTEIELDIPDGDEEDEAPEWSVVASHEGHYDYVLAEGLSEAEAKETAEHEGDPFYAVPSADVYWR